MRDLSRQTSRTSGSTCGANWLAISVFDGYHAIVDACCAAWNRFADNPATVTSITSRLGSDQLRGPAHNLAQKVQNSSLS